MERGGASRYTDQARTPLAVPSAAAPGRGVGNIPFAKGMMSGQFGSRVASIQPRAQTEPMPGMTSPQGPQAPPGPGGPPPPMTAPPPGPGMQSPFLDPSFYFDVMSSIMMALVSAAESETSFY